MADFEKMGNIKRDSSLSQQKDEPRTFKRWLQTSIDTSQHLLELELTTITLATGIIDAVTFPKFHCFVSNQTGNTVLFAVTALNLYGTRQQTDFQVPAPHLACSLGFFCIGVFLAGQTANRIGCKSTRWWLLASNGLQTCCVMITALLNFLFDTGRYGNQPVDTAPILSSISLLALSAGAQVAMLRQLGMPEIPTTQATAAYVDLFVDPNFFAPVKDNRSRNRRIIFLITLCVGSFIGAPAYRYVSTAFAIFLAGLVKVVVLGMFLFNRSEKPKEKLPV